MRGYCLPAFRILLISLLFVSAWAGAEAPRAVPEEPVYRVPFRLTETKHLLVRVKINRKGPFNFLVDTGAPLLFVSTAMARTIGVKPSPGGWATFERMEIEGGAILDGMKGRVEDPFQLEAMNALGLPGATIDGILGYTVLARFRMEIDLGRSRMRWTKLNFEPSEPPGLRAMMRADVRPGASSLDAVGKIARMAAFVIGRQPEDVLVPRGSWGIELAAGENAAVIRAVLPESPAATAGLKAGDRITHCQACEVKSAADLLQAAAGVAEGQTIRIMLHRGSESRSVSFKTGRGL